MDEADHVVVGLLVHGEPGVRRARHDLRHLGQRRRSRDELHLGPRHQHLADLPVRGFEHLRHDVPLVGAQRLVARHQVAQFLLGHHPAARLRVTAEQPHHQVGGPGQQPDQRAGQHRDPVQRRRRDQRHRSARCSASRLGASSPSTRVKTEIDHGHHDQRDGGRHPGTDVVPDQGGLQVPGQRGLAERAGQQGGQRDADLHRGQEPVRVLGQPGRALARACPAHERGTDWPSRSETRAISAPAKNPPTSTMSRTITMSQPTWFTS